MRRTLMRSPFIMLSGTCTLPHLRKIVSIYFFANYPKVFDKVQYI